MKIKTAVSMILNGHARLASRILKMADDFYRACFVSAAIREGIYDLLAEGPADLETIGKALGPETDLSGLSAWLELGVSLGELKRGPRGYSLKGYLSRALVKPGNDPYLAFLTEVVELHYRLATETPALLGKGETFPFDSVYGELVARSSRISEPFIVEAMENVIPKSGPFNLLEVGCGSGAYIKRACGMNPDLKATGLELQPVVADFARKNLKSWALDDRVHVEAADVRKFESAPDYDLVTLHQNIYYFPEDEREALFKRLINFIKPGGMFLLTTGCQGGGPGMQALNIWSVMTEGCGPLPDPDELRKVMESAGFEKVRAKKLIPVDSFWAFHGRKAG